MPSTVPVTTTRVGCAQFAPMVGDVAANRATSTAAVAQAAAAGAQVIVLPELATSGYTFRDPAESLSAAIELDDEVFEQWSAAAGGAIVVGGFAERGPDRAVYNSAALIDADGVRAVYRKTHLWDDEALYFTPGDAAAPVVDTVVGRIGVMICYDLEFPEMTRSVALRGAQLLAVPTNWPLVDRPIGERPPELIIGMAAARVNRMAIACCDRCGIERGQEWTAGTAVVNAEGWVVTEPISEPGLVTADIDLELARTKNISGRNHLFDDRRPQIYS